MDILEDTNLLDRPPIEVPPGTDVHDLREALIPSFARGEILGTLIYNIASISHLFPVRSEPQRVIVSSYFPSESVGQNGEYTLPHLQHIIESEGELYEFLKPHLQNVASIEKVDFTRSSGYVSQAFARNDVTGADVLISEFGFGLSQCLPIFVQGAIVAPHTTLIVEQPEAQLHPTAQLELGSFFADLWNNRQVGSIIETHSSNILLRLRRLIAKGELSNRDVSVAFFH